MTLAPVGYEETSLEETNVPPTTPKPMSSADFLASIPPYDENKDYLGPLLRAGYRVSVVSKTGTGKTSLLQEMGGAVARGDEFLGLKGAGVDVLYINLEMGDEQLGAAMRSARLPHPRFHVISRPDGMAIDEATPRGHADRQMLQRMAPDFRVVILDPWYQLLAVELPDSQTVGRIVRWLQGLQKRCPLTCFVFGKHMQENAESASVGAISGYKVFDRNADVIVGMDRIAGTDTSKLRWLKNRSPRLSVKQGEVWQLEWERGKGFVRSDPSE